MTDRMTEEDVPLGIVVVCLFFSVQGAIAVLPLATGLAIDGFEAITATTASPWQQLGPVAFGVFATVESYGLWRGRSWAWTFAVGFFGLEFVRSLLAVDVGQVAIAAGALVYLSLEHDRYRPTPVIAILRRTIR